jgi:carboxylesterase type B
MDNAFLEMKSWTEQQTQSAEQTNDRYTKLLQALRDRRTKLQTALNAESPQQQITANLPLILGILGAACVAAILGVRLFNPEIQMEWVASGQVIQFVTVMVLLSVTTALSLSRVIQENMLGTLLGGIAGYVLAQGVGRAAARDVARGVRANQQAQARAESVGKKGAQAGRSGRAVE